MMCGGIDDSDTGSDVEWEELATGMPGECRKIPKYHRHLLTFLGRGRIVCDDCKIKLREKVRRGVSGMQGQQPASEC